MEMVATIFEERDVRHLAALAVEAARRAETMVNRNGNLPRQTRQEEWLIEPLVRLEAELRFAPWDDFHCLLRRAVKVGFDYLDRKYNHCPMKYVVMIERELSV